MSTINRPLHSDLLYHRLADETAVVRSGSTMRSAGRNGRTLVKNGTLRVVLIGVAAGGRIPEHRSDGPITIQPIEGTIVLETASESITLGTGDLVSLDGRVEHAVSSTGGGVFLLTIAQSEESNKGEER